MANPDIDLGPSIRVLDQIDPLFRAKGAVPVVGIEDGTPEVRVIVPRAFPEQTRLELKKSVPSGIKVIFRSPEDSLSVTDLGQDS